MGSNSQISPVLNVARETLLTHLENVSRGTIAEILDLGVVKG